MADNVTLPGTGAVVATDEVNDGAGLRQFQLIKPAYGADGSATLVSASNGLPVQPAGTFPVVGTSTGSPLSDAAGVVVRQAPLATWATSFTESGSSMLTPLLTQRQLGTGVTVAQSSSNLVITAGTTTNAEFLARSVASFRGAMIKRARTILSQRIANNNFAIMLADRIGEGLSCTINSSTSITVTLTAHGFTADNVGQSMMIGAISGAAGVPGRYAIASIPTVDTINFTVAGWPASGSATVDLFGWNYVWTQYTGTTATSANVDAQRRGWNSGATAATINTTVSPGHLMQTAIHGRNIAWSDTLVASIATPTVTTRASRVQNIPDPSVELYVYLWIWNGTTAPASSTTWTIGFVSVEDAVDVPMYLAGVRPTGSAAPLPVAQQGTATVTFTQPALVAGAAAIGDVGVQYRANSTGAASATHLVSAASTNATVVKASAGRVLGWSFGNTTASWRYVKLHNVATTPTAGTGVVRTIAIPPGGVSNVSLEGGIGFATGIGLTAVTGSADADATAVGLGDIVGELFWA